MSATNVRDRGGSLHVAPAASVTAGARLPLGRIVVATNGGVECDTPVRFAAELARARGARPEFVTVVNAAPAMAVGFDPVASGALVDAALVETREARLARVEEQLARLTGDGRGWPVSVRFGAPALAIADEVAQVEPALVLVGLRPHGAIERIFRDDTTLRLMRRCAASVLALTPGLTALPKHVAVAVDFSRASMRAAAAAAQLVAHGGTLSLVHVQPGGSLRDRDGAEGLAVIYVQGVAAAFARMRRELPVPPGIVVREVYLEGDPAEELAEFAARSGAALIAIGSQRRSLASRMLLGSVTTALARDARCSLLVTPPRAA